MKHLKNPKIVLVLALLAFASVGYNIVYPLVKKSSPPRRQAPVQATPAPSQNVKQMAQNIATNLSTMTVSDAKKMAATGNAADLAATPLGIAMEARNGMDLVRAINGKEMKDAQMEWPGERERDPFFPLEKKKEKTEKKKKEFKLSAIVIEPGHNMAVVNGRTIREGETIDEFIVDKIERGKVTLSGPSGSKILKM